MGMHIHEAIVLTSWETEHIVKTHDRAKEIFNVDLVSPLSPKVMNGFRSFTVYPDGSKEGWDDSNVVDEQRKAFAEWLKEQNLYVDWIWLKFGGDLDNPEVEDHRGYEERD